VRRNDEVAAQRRRWTFYETIKIGFLLYARSVAARLVQMRISRLRKEKFMGRFQGEKGGIEERMNRGM